MVEGCHAYKKRYYIFEKEEKKQKLIWNMPRGFLLSFLSEKKFKSSFLAKYFELNVHLCHELPGNF